MRCLVINSMYEQYCTGSKGPYRSVHLRSLIKITELFDTKEGIDNGEGTILTDPLLFAFDVCYFFFSHDGHKGLILIILERPQIATVVHFISIQTKRSEQTVQTQIRRRTTRRLIRV